MDDIADFRLKKFDVDGKTYEVCVPNIPQDQFFAGYMQSTLPYEYTMLTDMASRIHEGDHILDVGGHIANHSLYLTSVTGCNSTIFEPNPLLHPSIEGSLAKNHLKDKITLIKKGVGEKPSTAHFEARIDQNIGMQSLSVSEDAGNSVEVIALDDMLADLPPIKLMKVDVEGMEVAVLKGAKKLIETHKPPIYIECRAEEDYLPVHNWMSEAGYVWCATFNATPTHLYVHSSTMTAEQRVECLIHKQVRESYYRQQQINEAIRKLQQLSIENQRLKQMLAQKGVA